MRKFTPFLKLSSVLALAALAGPASAQIIFFNNGAQIYTAPAAIVQVNGGFRNDGAAGTTPVFENDGTMTIANSGTPGTVFLSNGSTLRGDGTLRVEQNWVNDASFVGDNSTVIMFGNTQQYITSSTGVATTFHNLTLTGTGTGAARKKTLQSVNASTDATGILALNDRELETQANVMAVLNPATAAITNATTFLNEGFVSSALGGGLSRVTNAASAYLFPTGSSSGTQRYRAVQMKPATAATNVYLVRLGNNTATTDGFDVTQLDNTMCKVTALFYHQISRLAGVDNADIDIFYDQAADGPWDGLAQWGTPTAAQWNTLGTVAQTTSATYNDNLKTNWSDFSMSPYILSRAKLADPVFACSDVCVNSSGNIFTASGAPAGAGYTWTSPVGTNITSGQGTNTVTIDWNSTGGPITVTSTNAVGCFSDPVSCTVNVSTPPTADFDTTSTGFDYFFTDISTGGATSWSWDFGDGGTSTAQNPSHQFTSNGPQNVCLYAANSTGCVDTICRTVLVDVTEFINIPNVFTPDNDGNNDVFVINNTGLKEYSIEIFNRWGIKVFEAEAANITWDGRSTSGVPLSDGTYFYILKAVSVTNKDYSQNGFINLIRGK